MFKKQGKKSVQSLKKKIHTITGYEDSSWYLSIAWETSNTPPKQLDSNKKSFKTSEIEYQKYYPDEPTFISTLRKKASNHKDGRSCVSTTLTQASEYIS